MSLLNKKYNVRITGKTNTGALVIGGVFKLVETRGIPIDSVVDSLKSNNMLVDWIDFYESSVTHNWNIKSTFNKIRTALIDVYDKDHADNVIERLHYYLNRKYET